MIPTITNKVNQTFLKSQKCNLTDLDDSTISEMNMHLNILSCQNISETALTGSSEIINHPIKILFRSCVFLLYAFFPYLSYDKRELL